MSAAALPSDGRIENTPSSVVASVSDAADTCFSCRCLAMTVSTGSTVPTFAFMSCFMATQNDVGYLVLAEDTMNFT